MIALRLSAGLALYTAVIGTFVALHLGEQRAAYMVTVFAVGLLIVPFLAGWIPLLTTEWLAHAALVFGAFAVLLGLIGVRIFRRDMVVLYLQE